MTDEQRKKRIVQQLPDILDFMADFMTNSGNSIFGAMSFVHPNFVCELADIFRQVIIEINLGLSFEDALRRMTTREDIDELMQVAEEIYTAHQYGYDMVSTLRNQAQRIRDQQGS